MESQSHDAHVLKAIQRGIASMEAGGGISLEEADAQLRRVK